MAETITRAAAYLRVSGRGQLNGDGFDRQREAIEKYASAHNIRVVSWFEEKGISGTTEWEDRPAWVDLLASLNNQTKTIIIERLDRLARDLGVQEYIVRDLEKRKINLVSTAEPDLGDKNPTRVLFRQIIGAIASYEKSVIVAKLRSARDRMKRRGEKCEGRYNFGSDPKRPEEGEVLRLIMTWREQGYNFSEIATKLNAAQISSRDSTRWYQATVSRIIHREEAKNA